MIGALRNAYARWCSERAEKRQSRELLTEIQRIIIHETAYRMVVESGGLDAADSLARIYGALFRQAQENSNVHGT